MLGSLRLAPIIYESTVWGSLDPRPSRTSLNFVWDSPLTIPHVGYGDCPAQYVCISYVLKGLETVPHDLCEAVWRRDYPRVYCVRARVCICVYLIYKGDVVCVCVFAIRGYNDEPVETKLGMVIVGPKVEVTEGFMVAGHSISTRHA